MQENIRTLLKATTEVKKYIKLKIDENKDTYDEEHINSFVDVYLKLSHESQDSTLCLYAHVQDPYYLIGCNVLCVG